MALASDTAAGDGALRANLAPTRARILRSTYRIMGVKGGMRFALREVADDAGVSKALLLYHFRTKESLVLATLRWVLDAVAARIQRAIEPIETAGEKVEVMLDTIFIRADLNRHFYLVYADLLGLAARMEAYGEVATTFHDTVNAMYAEIADLGIREGIFAARDAQVAAAVMRAIIDGMFMQWLLEADWVGTHAAYRALCKRALVSYLRGGEMAR